MSKSQIVVVSTAILLFAGLYFGGQRTPKAQKEIETTRIEAAKTASINEIIGLAKSEISESDRNELAALESQLEIAGSDSTKLAVFKNLSSKWYKLGNYAVSGFYAEEVAQLDKTDFAWGVAGYSYAICFNQTKNERMFSFCFDKAIAAYENAASIAPDSIVYKENLAYCYTGNPDPNQTMTGIKIYQGILEQNPDNIKVLLRLGKLSVEVTKDYPKAINRLEKAVRVAPKNFEANYYLAVAYEGNNEKALAKEFYSKALALTNDKAIKDRINQLLSHL